MAEEHPCFWLEGEFGAAVRRAIRLGSATAILVVALAAAACSSVAQKAAPAAVPTAAPSAEGTAPVTPRAEVTARGFRVADLPRDTTAEQRIRDLLGRLDIPVSQDGNGVRSCRIGRATVRWRAAERDYLRICAITEHGDWEGHAEWALDLVRAWIETKGGQTFPEGFSRLQVDEVRWGVLFSAAEAELVARGFPPRQEIFIQDGNVLSAGGKPDEEPAWIVRLLEADPMHAIMSVTHVADPWDAEGEEAMAVAILRRVIGADFDVDHIHRFRYP